MRKVIHRMVSFIALTTIFASGFSNVSMARSSAITSVSIKIEMEIESGDRLPAMDVLDLNSGDSSSGVKNYISTSNNKYNIREYEWVTSESKDMTIGEEPKLKIYLNANDADDYYFKGSYGSSNISIKGGTYVSAKKSGGDLEVTVKADPVKGNYKEPDEAYWRDSGFGKARWDSDNKGSGAYDVYLYRGSTTVKKLEAYKGTSYDFYPYMTKEGTYHFKVRMVPYTDAEKKYGKKSEWLESDEIYIGKDDVSDGKGQESGGTGADDNSNSNNNTNVGWILDGTWYYRYPDGSYQKDSWAKINDKWYLFDTNGRMLTGWQTKNGQTYFLRNEGDMLTGWLQSENKWYFFNTNTGGIEGAMCTGWIQLGDKIYYLNQSGVMIEGWQKVGEDWYYFYPGQGHKAADTLIDGFYVDSNGIWRK